VKTRIKGPDGKPVDGTELDFKIESDPEIELKLEDGSMLYIKVVVSNVVRIDGIHDPITGDPAYFVQSQPIIRVKADPSLKKLS